MPIRPTMGGFQAPQWLMETIRNLEQSIRRLEESINSLKRGETLSPTPRTQDVPTSTTTGGGGSGGAWNGGLGISINSQPATANAKLLNLKSGAGIALAKATDVTGQVDITIAASNIPAVITSNILVHTASSSQAVTNSYAEVTPLTVTIPTHTNISPGFRLCRFEAHVIFMNASNTNNRDAYLKITSHTDTMTPDNFMFVDYTWGADHNEAAWYKYPNSLSTSTEVHITGIPAGTGYPFSGDPNYLTVHIVGTTQYHTEHDTLIKFYVHDGTGSGLYVAADSNVTITPLT